MFRVEWPSQKDLSLRSDIYVYFFTHAAHLLKPGGYLGFVTSIGWLDTDYGFRLQEFFLRNFRIVAVIESQVEKWFEDARVTTAVTILQRETDEAQRNSNPVRFIQLRRPLAEIYSRALDRTFSEEGETTRQGDMDAIRDLIEEIDTPQVTDYWRVRIQTQQELWQGGVLGGVRNDDEQDNRLPEYSGGKWGQYVRGPHSWFDLIDRSGNRMTALQNLAQITRGFTSGADRFYCVRDVTQRELKRIPDPKKFLDRWGFLPKDASHIRIVQDGMKVEHLVEKRFLEPEIHTLMDVKRAVITTKYARRLVVNASVPRIQIRQTHFEDYVVYAEQQGWHLGSTIADRARTKPWYDLGLSAQSERADIFWPMSQQYRHVVPLNADLLPANHNLFELWRREDEDPDLLWAVLNSTITVLAKHQFGRAAGIEGNLKTEVIDVKMMLVPDIRHASPEAATRAIAACRQMSRRDAKRFLYEEFALEERRELDDATLEILGIEDADERMGFRERIYRDITAYQLATRERELIAQRDRAGANRRTVPTAQDLVRELWLEHQADLELLQFPEDFVNKLTEGEFFDLPTGDVQVGTAMIAQGNHLRVGTIRVGGRDGEVIDVGSFSRGRFLEALSLCHRSGQVRLPSDDICEAAVNNFDQYRNSLQNRCVQLAQQRTADQRRQKTVADSLLRKALQWERPSPYEP